MIDQKTIEELERRCEAQDKYLEPFAMLHLPALIAAAKRAQDWPRHREQLQAENQKLAKRVAERDALLHRLVDHESAPCRFDHHGFCQDHLGNQEPGDCATYTARAALNRSEGE